MNKTIGIFVLAMLVFSSLALATSGFQVDKYTSVTGDWKYDGGWQNGIYETGTYATQVKSNGATMGYYVEPVEKLGEPWKYKLEAHTGFNAPGTIKTQFSAWTVNDPDTTPATGGYTGYNFVEHTTGDYSSSHLVVKGEGQVNVETNLFGQSGIYRDTYLRINE